MLEFSATDRATRLLMGMSPHHDERRAADGRGCAATLAQRVAIVDRIEQALRARLDDHTSPGLFDGACGQALFYAYLYEHTRDDAHLEVAHRIIERLVDLLATGHVSASHCGGLAGIAWCLDHLLERGLIDLEGSRDELFTPVDELLCLRVLADLRDGRRDFLHHGLGAVPYLVARSRTPAVRACLEAVVDELERTSVTDESGTRWVDHLRDAGGALVFNLGLAHGIPGILTLLSLIYERGIAVERASRLLRAGVRWVRASRLPDEDQGVAMYPIRVDGNGNAIGAPHSRLGWCYGDLGIATAFAGIGARTGDRELVDDAHAMLRHTLAHRTPENGEIADASLCHGSMGVAQIYRRAHLSTGDGAFLAAAEQWLQHGLTLAQWVDGAAGFKARMRDGFETRLDLLQGVSGIGLAMVAALGPAGASAWARCLLIS
jgi:lantibiotic modifying enzyme